MKIMGILSDDFISLFVDDPTINDYAKKMLAAKQAEHAGEIRWNDLFEVREKIIALEKEQVNLSGEGAQKLQKFLEQ